MIAGLMQNTPLQISAILRFMATAHPRREIVSRLVDEPIWRYDYGRFAERVGRAARMLERLGTNPGDRVTSLAWNTHRHLELFYAVPGIGSVLHTANPRLSDEQLAFTINDAGSEILLFDKTFLPLLERLAPALPNIRHFVMLAGDDALEPGTIGALGYESEISREAGGYDWPVFDENSAAFLCYTSGTTGNPKGVLYSHRAVVFHAVVAGLSGGMNLSAFDCVMPCSSLYHATAWGLPFASPINGSKIVLPCDRMDGASLQELIEQEGVTLSGGVPTIWTGYLAHLERTGSDAASLERVIIGGSAVPRAMAAKFQKAYGVQTLQLWGMTETCPVGVVATPTPQLAERGEEAMREVIWTRQGRLQFGIELRIVDDQGNTLPHDGETSGALLVRGPWTIERYYKSETSAVDPDGWFDTGDIATLDSDGFMRITDRKKDVIKSGGEWISSIDLENLAVSFPGVRIAAAVGVYHPRWEERPVLIIEPEDEGAVSVEAVLGHIEPHVAKWWMPDRAFIDNVPLTATGKIDKKVLRERYKDCLSD